MDLVQLDDFEFARLAAEVRTEARRRTAAAVSDTASIIKGMEAQKRAILVAAAGEHSILFAGPIGCGKSMLRALAAELGAESYETRLCPCGNYGDLGAKPCGCDVADIGRTYANMPAADIFCSVTYATNRELESRLQGTSAADMRRMIANMGVAVSLQLDETCGGLLRAAARELFLTPQEQSAAIRIAATIARLDRADRIQLQHLSEAINYRHASYANRFAASGPAASGKKRKRAAT